MNRETTRRRFLQRGSEVAAVTAVVSTMGGVHSEAAVQKEIERREKERARKRRRM